MNLFTLRKSRGLLAGLLLMTLLATMIFPGAVLAAEPYDTYNNLALQAVRNNYGLYQGGTAVDGAYGNFAAYDAYMLVKAGINLTEWVCGETSFADSLTALIDTTIAVENDSDETTFPSSAKRVAHEYLVAKELRETSKAIDLLSILDDRQTTNVTTGVYGIDTGDYAIYSNIPAFEALCRTGDISELNAEATITYILDAQDPDTKAWPIANADLWITNDFATTAQAVRVLHALRSEAGEAAATVQAAIDTGVEWLKSKQLTNGSFKNLDDDPLVDAVEALLTMEVLDLEYDAWITEEGIGVIDYLQDNALNENGTFGGNASNGNLVDNTMALEAYLLLGGVIAPEAVLGVKVTPATAELEIGETQQYAAEAFKIGGDWEDVSAVAAWSTDDTGVATVDSEGLVTGVSSGSAVVTATYQGVSGAAGITVAGGGGGGGHASGTPIRVEVIGKNGRTLYARNTVYLNAGDKNFRNYVVGITPVGALEKTGLSYDYDSINYIHTIAGIAPEGMNGWMVKVNGTSLGDPAISYTLRANDLVVWFYSTDSGNLAGMSGPNPQQNKTGDQLITDALKDNKEVVIDLTKQANGLLQLKPETVQKLAEAQKPLNISGKGLEIAMTPQALGTEQVQAALEGGAALQLGIKEVTSAEKQEILTGAKLGQSTGIFEIGGKIFDLSAELISTDSESNQITERISSFGEPVPVTLDLSGLNLTEEDIAQLTAVRYEKDAAGKIIPVKLGGSYDPETKVFTFYTEKFSYYGIAKAEKLVTVSMGIDKLTVTINGKRGYTDAPPVLLNNRTMVPLRFIAETLGAQVQWLAESRTAEIRLDGQTLRLVAEELVPGMDTPATIKSARLLVPLRYISEALGARVTWFAAEQRIELVY